MGAVSGLQQRASASALELRSALARCSETADLFSAGEQSDAAEALESLLRALDTAMMPPGASQLGLGAPTLLKNLCGLSVQEVWSLPSIHDPIVDHSALALKDVACASGTLLLHCARELPAFWLLVCFIGVSVVSCLLQGIIRLLPDWHACSRCCSSPAMRRAQPSKHLRRWRACACMHQAASQPHMLL